jgi:hypothetical protein
LVNEFAPVLRPSRKTLVLSVLGLAVFLAFEAILLRHYVRVDTRPPSWDQSVHLEIALDYREAIKAGRWSDAWFLPPKSGMPPFPPLYHLLMSGAYSSPDPAHSALWYNWLYLALLGASLFGIAWRFLPDSRALAATILFCSAPGIQELYTTQLVDLAVVALTAAAYWAFLSCEGFSSLPESLAFGAAFGVGMLHKWSFFSYFLPVYVVAARALSDRRARPRVLAAAALAFALAAPWYWSHIALLPSRLAQASSDFGVPFWKGDAWFVYFRESVGPLGPVLWALGFLGILTPQYARRREYGWVVAYWVLFSYVFWTIVPNRQIRFLLPGLAPLGLAVAATWPSSITWGAALFQLLGAVNFFFGWVGPFNVPIPLMTLPLLVNRPPASEDWKIDEILTRVEADRDRTRPLTNVTLVANDIYFNGPTFHWVQRRRGFTDVAMRGVNKRLCELSEFVLVKDGDLGPDGVIGGLPEAVKKIKDPEGWFRVAYEEDARWPLPDRSAAVLYRLRRNRPSPLSRRQITFDIIESGSDRVESLRASFGEWQRDRSAWRSAEISAGRVFVRDLNVTGIRARLDGPSLVIPGGDGLSAFEPDTVRLTRLDRLSIESLQVTADDLKAFLVKRVPGLELDSLTLDGTARASGRWKGKAVALEAALDLDRAARVLRVRVISASYMGTPLPVMLFRPIKELTISLDPNPETPFSIELSGITMKGGRLTVP